MISSPLLHTDSEGGSLHAIQSLSALRSLDEAGVAALESIGVRSVGDLLHWDAVHHARTLMALARGGRRMADTAAHLVDRVRPRVSVRQWVLSLPFSQRFGVG